MIATLDLEAIARVKGWLASQHAHGPSDAWLIEVDHDTDRVMFRIGVLREQRGVDLQTAALAVLLEISGLPAADGRSLGHVVLDAAARTYGQLIGATERVDVSREDAEALGRRTFLSRPEAAHVIRLRRAYVPDRSDDWAARRYHDLGEGLPGLERYLADRWRPREPDSQAVATLRQLAARIRDDALVLADRWQSEGVGLSTVRIPDSDPPRTCTHASAVVDDPCSAPAQWKGNPGFEFCHEHRPRDGHGDELAAGIATGRFWDLEDDEVVHAPYSPRLDVLITTWLDGAEIEDWSIRWALHSALRRCPERCPSCNGRGRHGHMGCRDCDGHGRVSPPPAT